MDDDNFVLDAPAPKDHFTMTRARLALVSILTALLGSCAQNTAAVQENAASVAAAKDDKGVLFWSIEQRDARFDKLEQFGPSRRVSADGKPHALSAGKSLDLKWSYQGHDWTLASYMEAQRSAGIIIIQDGKVRAERYGLGLTAQGRWASFSVAKSLTSTLVGAAIRDGFIKSVSEPITRYIPELAGSGYDGVTIEQILTMSSGVRWNEAYADPRSDVAQFGAQQAEGTVDPVTSYMRKLPRAAQPGTKWNYNTGETNLIGVLVERATGKTLSSYLQEKIWQPFGMERDAAWLLNSGGHEFGGCCIQASLRDYARFGLFVLGDGKAGGQDVVPLGWFEKAVTTQKDIGTPGFGYGYQWWTRDDGSFAARGIFGQMIFIDPKRKLVVVSLSNWPAATEAERSYRQIAFIEAIRSALDAEAKD
jgi:CubicO group peptidase (beta-lactamase class C family)